MIFDSSLEAHVQAHTSYVQPMSASSSFATRFPSVVREPAREATGEVKNRNNNNSTDNNNNHGNNKTETSFQNKQPRIMTYVDEQEILVETLPDEQAA